MSRTYVEIAGKRLPLTNPDKLLYPSYGFTKAGILEYYRGIAQAMLPHLRDRAVTMKRYPEGVGRDFFYEKRCPGHRPGWVQTAEIPQESGGRIRFCVVNDLETLLWAQNLAALELHVPLARADSPGTPDSMVFDLDPGEPATVLECARVALILRGLLSRVGLLSVVKTSGQKGLHVFVPLNRRETTFDKTRTFSRAVATVMQKHHPDLVTANMAKNGRRGKVLINWSQNDGSKTMICVYSLRAQERPFVSFPLAWDALEDADAKGNADALAVTHAEALRRVQEQGDLFREMIVREQRLPHL